MDDLELAKHKIEQTLEGQYPEGQALEVARAAINRVLSEMRVSAPMPEGKRRGDWLQTVSGKQFWPLDPRVEEIDIGDIAHALSMQCRYAGHSIHFYSVAEHCCHISDACPNEHALWGLLHDASEAYLTDVIRPIKPALIGYKAIEERLMACICERFGLPVEQPEIVSELDRRILGNECAGVMAPPPIPWYHTGAPLPNLILPCWPPMLAAQNFLTRFYYLTAKQPY